MRSSSEKSDGKNEIVKDKIREYLADKWKDLIDDIDSLDPKERIDRRMKLMEYVMPKVQAVRVEEHTTKSAAKTLLSLESEYDEGYVENEDLTVDP